MLEELLAACGILVTYETVRRWDIKLGEGLRAAHSQYEAAPGR